MLYESVSITFLKRQKCRDRGQSSSCRGLWVGRGGDTVMGEHEGGWQGEGAVLCPARGSTDLYVCA